MRRFHDPHNSKRILCKRISDILVFLPGDQRYCIADLKFFRRMDILFDYTFPCIFRPASFLQHGLVQRVCAVQLFRVKRKHLDDRVRPFPNVYKCIDGIGRHHRADIPVCADRL